MAGEGRFDYIAYDEVAQGKQARFKDRCQELEAMAVNEIGPGRELSLVLTKLEEVYMWIGKGIKADQVKRRNSAELQEQRGDS